MSGSNWPTLYANMPWILCAILSLSGCGLPTQQEREETKLGLAADDTIRTAIKEATGKEWERDRILFDVNGDEVTLNYPNLSASFLVIREKVYPINDGARALLPGFEGPPDPDAANAKRRSLEGAVGDDLVTDIIIGRRTLSDAQIDQMEDVLKNSPEDLETRAQLLAHYWDKRLEDEFASRNHERHVLWLVEHAPDSWLAGNTVCELDDVLNEEAYARAKELWIAHAEKPTATPQLLSNAANFFLISDESLSEKYLSRCIELDPSNPEWKEELAFLHSLEAESSISPEDPAAAAKALELFESVLASADSEQRVLMLEEAAKMALVAGEVEKAIAYAEEVIAKAPRGNWNYGNALHHANIVLGRIALQKGNTDEAKRRLHAAGDVPGSPQLDSFGPELSLAEELLAAGEKQAVLEYIDQVAEFWEGQDALLDKWKAQIERGETPDFDKTWEE